MYEYFTNKSIGMTALFAGIVQTMLYADFFYYYVQSIRKGKSTVSLPL